MNYFLMAILICAVLLTLRYHFRLKALKANVSYIAGKLMDISKNATDEQVIAFNDESEVQDLLNAINQILELNRYNRVEKVKYQNSMKRMLANISHDLKTPLTVINGYIDTMLLAKSYSPVQLNKVSDKSNELIHLINQFFDLAKLESHDMDLPLSRINVSEISKVTVLNYFDMISKKGFDMKLDIEEGCFVMGNEKALIRALDNLISKAIRYGCDGQVIGLEVKIVQGHIKVSVWDNGKGIEIKHLNDVFERLYTLEDSRNKDYQGSGLGLTITKRLVEQMSGTISLKSTPYVKTEFTMTFDSLSYS